MTHQTTPVHGGARDRTGNHLPDHLAPLRARSRQFRQRIARYNTGLSPAQVPLAFGLARLQVSAVLLGVRSREELAEQEIE